MKVLLDTCVISELRKSNGDQNVFDFVQYLPIDHLFINSMKYIDKLIEYTHLPTF